MKIIIAMILLSQIQVPFPYDPNQCSGARIIRWYEGEPNKPVLFNFWVRDDDGDRIDRANVMVTGASALYIAPPVADPNGLLTRFSGDIKEVAEKVVYLKIYAHDRQPGDSRPIDEPNEPSGPKSDTAFILINVRKPKINTPPVIG